MTYRNSSFNCDPTAGAAIANITREEKREARRLAREQEYGQRRAENDTYRRSFTAPGLKQRDRKYNP